MQVSYTRVSAFVKCPYQYKLRYIDKLETLPSDDPANALILGSALHKGIEVDINAAKELYFNSYPVITDKHIDEALKLEYWIPRVKDKLSQNGTHEMKIFNDDFIGFIDLLEPTEPPVEFVNGEPTTAEGEWFDMYDFKYANSTLNYKDSGQLHVYKYYFEMLYPNKHIKNMYFMFIPKSALRIKYKNKTNKRDETLREFRKRIIEDLDKKEIQLIKVNYDPKKVIEFLTNTKHLIECEDHIKCPSKLCDWCEYQKLCERGDDIDMQLPSIERRKIEGNTYKKIWIYGSPFSGKTYLANKFETPLMLNTDGNFKQVDAPVIRIVDEVTTEGRITKRKYAWEIFQETITELEKKQNDFKTIIVDLVEDVYDACRVKVCVDNGWDHESDDSFKAYDIVRSEFLRTMKRLLNLDYNIVLISHEDSSKDLTKRGGDKITAIKPNLQEKIALKIAGMVDMVVRIINNEGNRIISFKSDEVTFGGGRIKVEAKEIPCEYEELMKVYGSTPKTLKEELKDMSGEEIKKLYEEANKIAEENKMETAVKVQEEVETPEHPADKVEETAIEEPVEKPKRVRRKRNEEEGE